jgi:hypothetical protein
LTRVVITFVIFDTLHDPDAETVRGVPDDVFIVNFRMREVVTVAGTVGAFNWFLAIVAFSVFGFSGTIMGSTFGMTVNVTTTSEAGSKLSVPSCDAVKLHIPNSRSVRTCPVTVQMRSSLARSDTDDPELVATNDVRSIGALPI